MTIIYFCSENTYIKKRSLKNSIFNWRHYSCAQIKWLRIPLPTSSIALQRARSGLKMSEENWSFIRLGYNKAQQIFVLESHLSPIKVGRATFNDLQCKGELWIIIFKNLSSIQKTFFFCFTRLWHFKKSLWNSSVWSFRQDLLENSWSILSKAHLCKR